MTIFKSFTLTWWQGGLFKWGVFLLRTAQVVPEPAGLSLLGIAVGAWWSTFFGDFIPLLLIISGVFLAYVTYIWWKQ